MMNQHILITGATKGIGRACAERFAADGWSVTAVARTSGDLDAMQADWQQRFPQTTLTGVVADLSTPAGIAAVPLAAYTVILLNAAVFAPGQLLDEADKFEELLQLNVLGNHRLVRRLLSAHQPNHLVVIGSTGTDHWKAHMTAYVATKYALRGLFLGWREELRPTAVRTTLVAPGATLTASWDNETPPPDILAPGRVAEVVRMAVENGTEGRIIIDR